MTERSLTQQKIALFVIDVLVFFAALNGAIWLRYSSGLPLAFGHPPWREIFLAFPVVALTWAIACAAFGGYRVRVSRLEEISSVVRASLVAFLMVLSATFFYRGFSYSRGMIGFFIPLVLFGVTGARMAFRGLRRRALSRFAGRSRVAILGTSRIGDSLVEALGRDADYYDLVGVIEFAASGTPKDASDSQATREMAPFGSVPVLGTVDELDRICQQHRFDSLVLVDRTLSEEAVLDSIEACLRHQVTWSMIPAVHELLIDRARVQLVDGIPLVGMRRTNIVGFNWMLKRAFDILVSSMLLLLASPLVIGVAIAIKLSSKGPVLYVQKRVGYRGQVFPFYKFRSMHTDNDDTIHREYTKKWIRENAAHTDGARDDPDGDVHKITNDPRVFGVGRLIRKYSVDELPQLLNVLRGEMSLIGPRPALPYEVDVYREWHRRRFEAPPGITGLWQVSGRNRLSFEEMIKLDIDYLENWSFLLDLQILVRTIRVVLFEHAY